jgi:hypothetical protein
MEVVTGFEIDGQRIAKEQVIATNRLAKAIEELALVIEQNAK